MRPQTSITLTKSTSSFIWRQKFLKKKLQILFHSPMQSWLFVGISHPTKKSSDPGYKKSPGYPEGLKSRNIPNPGDFAKIPGIKKPEIKKNPDPRDKKFRDSKKIPNSGDLSKISGIFRKSRWSENRKKPIFQPSKL